MWGVGDKAVCIEDAICVVHGTTVVRGRVYLVDFVSVNPFDPEQIALSLAANDHFWSAHIFRKIQPADEEFSEKMKSLRPRAPGEKTPEKVTEDA